MKITILWSSLAGYSVAFFRELAENQNCRIQLIFQPVKNEAPYNGFDLSFCDIALEDSPAIKKRLENLVSDFKPDCVLMSSWGFPQYMNLCKKLRKQNVYVISSMDNQWNSSFKQWIGVFTSKFFLKPSIDTFLVTGDRQANFARKLGYDDVLYGYAAADVDKFQVDRSGEDWPRSFLFIGRLIPIKGIDLLVRAYKKYRNLSKRPWDLKIVGTGPLRSLLDGVPGVKYFGFIQPKHIPSIMKESGCLVLSSLFENWGVVIHEACAAGLPVIASYNCGAITYYLRDGVNGYIVSPNEENVTEAMIKISELSYTDLDKMSRVSHQLAKLWTPRTLAEYFKSSVAKNIKS
jgi:glycosyltransferase involved in cell wall biosynthesis